MPVHYGVVLSETQIWSSLKGGLLGDLGLGTSELGD